MRAPVFSAVVVVVLGAAAASLSAQSLADVARKEEERRKHTPAAGKVYTNKDLGAAPAPSTPPAPAPPSPDAPTPDEKGAAGKEPAAGASGAEPAKDQKYWRDRMTAALTAADRDQTLADAMQSRINALTTDFVNRDDPAQRSVIARDRDRAVAELERLKKQIVDDKKAIAAVEEEARRAGVPPGWLR